MRYLPLAAVLVALAFAPAASARAIDPALQSPVQNLSSPDAQDANAAQDAQTLQDLARLRGAPNFHTTSKDDSALAQEQYYSSYGPASHPARTAPADDDSPWLAIGLGLGLIALVAVSVAVAVRTRRRASRVRVAV
jgi:hypothetical protein